MFLKFVFFLFKVKPVKEATEPEKTTNGETTKAETETEKVDKETAVEVKETEEKKTNEEEEKTQAEEETKLTEAAANEPEVVEEPETVDEPAFDIDKVLAETAVPEVSADFESAVKKSVKFSQNLSKDIALKTIRVMQPESNLTDPQDVDDEFAFTEEPKYVTTF